MSKYEKFSDMEEGVDGGRVEGEGGVGVGSESGGGVDNWRQQEYGATASSHQAQTPTHTSHQDSKW